jgi:hypothetical protein
MENSNTTRYLCAAAQLDSTFRKQVLEKVIDEEYRFISISSGVDLLLVAKHCIDGRRREIILNIIISILFVITCISVENERAQIQPIFSSLYPPDSIWHNHPTLISLFKSCFPYCFLLTWIICFCEAWFTRYRIITKHLLANNFNPDCVGLLASTDEVVDKLSQILNEEQNNVVIYSGYSPFVGSGIDVGGWSFTLNIYKGKEEIEKVLTPELFTIHELYSRIDSDIRKINFNQTSIQDKIFVNGQDIRFNERILPNPFNRPNTRIDPLYFKELIESESDTIRHYKCIRVIGWQGEIILSVFLRFVKLRQNLFVEVSYFLLTPLKEEYRKIDEMQPSPTWRKLFELIRDSLVRSLFLFPFAILFLSEEIFRPWNLSKQRKLNRRLIRENLRFDYGAVTSIRELASSNSYHHYFQELDKEMFLKIIEKQIFDSITDFLDDHHIDTSELRSRQNTVLNNGVIISGGSVSTENFTVGTEARSVINNMAQALSSVTHKRRVRKK